jgi:hypothetical protein
MSLDRVSADTASGAAEQAPPAEEPQGEQAAEFEANLANAEATDSAGGSGSGDQAEGTGSGNASETANGVANTATDAASAAAEEVVDTTMTPVDPVRAINQLNSDGDRVVIAGTLEAKAMVGVGGKGQYGYGITVQQSGDSQTPGVADDAKVQYDVTFDKKLLGGIVAELPVPVVNASGELNLRSADSVTMTFQTREEATRAVQILERVAVAETVRDVGSLVSPGPSLDNPASNPIADGTAGNTGSGNPLQPGTVVADAIADRVGPSQADLQFLGSHITEYSQTLGTQGRINLGAKLNNLGLDVRFDQNQDVTRTVRINQEDGSGRVTYSVSGEFDVTSKQKLTLGLAALDQVEIGLTPQNIMDHGTLSGEVSLSYDLPAGTFNGTGGTISGSGRPFPEPALLESGQLGTPDELSVNLQLEHQNQLIDPTRTDLTRRTLEVSVEDPTQQSFAVVNQLLSGDVQGAMAQMGTAFQTDYQVANVERSGFNHQHELGFKFADGLEAKVSLIAEVGVDDVTPRGATPPVGGSAGDTVNGDQLVVVPRDGLNVRSDPSADSDRTSVLYHGTFVQPTGNTATDGSGRQWVEVTGPDVNDRPVTGWVAAAYVAPHPQGAMDETGRINPDLERRGFEEYTVEEGDNLWSIAQREGVDFQDMVQLNSDHLIDPSLIFAGDKVYIPGTGGPDVVAQPPAPETPTNPTEPSTPGNPTEPSTPSAESQPSVPTQPSQLSQPSGSDTGSGPVTGPGTGSGSGSGSGSGPVTGPAQPSGPQPGQQGGNPPIDPARPNLDTILNNYQVHTDQRITWEPSVRVGPFQLPEFVQGPLRDLGERVLERDFSREMTRTEGQMLDGLQVPQLADFLSIYDRSFSTADRMVPWDGAVPQRFGQNDGHNDAFRHAYWNAQMTSSFGESWARDFAVAHEAYPANEGPREAMDLYNNEVGRRIAVENPNASPEQLAQLVKEALDNGELLVIDSNGRLAWSDQVPMHQHGLADGQPERPGVIPVPNP